MLDSDGATAVVPYSLRNNLQALVTIPIAWSELRKLKSPGAFSAKDVIIRFKKKQNCWSAYFKIKQTIKILDQAKK